MCLVIKEDGQRGLSPRSFFFFDTSPDSYMAHIAPNGAIEFATSFAPCAKSYHSMDSNKTPRQKKERETTRKRETKKCPKNSLLFFLNTYDYYVRYSLLFVFIVVVVIIIIVKSSLEKETRRRRRSEKKK